MTLLIFTVFVLGYIAITMEHTLKMDKLIPALLMMVACWTLLILGVDNLEIWLDPAKGVILGSDGEYTVPKLTGDHEHRVEMINEALLHHFGKTAEILIFLMGAMAIVEMIDFFDGFSSIKGMIKTRSKAKLLWIVSFLAFFLSAIIDNLTATIVLITILRKIISNQEDRMWYAGFIIIAANAGGAWTPIGDVTTTMLWMANKVSTGELVIHLGLPSLVCILLPLIVGNFLPAFKGQIEVMEDEQTNPNSKLMLYLGLFLIICVPIFKTVTHLPPYLGMMLSLAVFAIIAEFLSNRAINLTDATDSHGHSGPTMKALSKIEMPSVLFFLGILMTVAAMESAGLIFNFGQDVKNAGIPEGVFVTMLGVASAIIDNVPLVAASIGMFQEPMDAEVWHFIAFAAGTGGSMLIIGSAAGVVAMGMEKISFFWYMKRISLLAALGYFGGIGVFLLMPKKDPSELEKKEDKKQVETTHHWKTIGTETTYFVSKQ
ncbi:MAG: sodium:proton antiporter NhaD [Bacteroidetes bacterium]|nr:sodium:proton antiporter NhaD [Bacteroidota bacterium]